MLKYRLILLPFFLGFLTLIKSQNVGIGIDTPQARLHVSGTVMTDSLRMPPGARADYWMRSDSLGNASWEPLLKTFSGASLVDATSLLTRPEYIAIQDQYMYVISDALGDSLIVYDISISENPVRIARIRIQFQGVAQGLVVHGDFAYADYSNRIQVYDISDPMNPLFRSYVSVGSEDLAYANGYLYVVSNFDNALITINASNPDSLFHTDTIGVGGDPNGIAIQNGKAYIVDAGSLDLKIFDLADDVLLLDIDMPNMNGISACKHILKAHPHMKVIALSMMQEASIIRKMLEAGAVGYLVKNTGKQELLACLQAVQNGKTYYSSSVSDIILNHMAGARVQSDTIYPRLSRREKQILKLIVDEMTTGEIAEKLGISFGTVETHRRNIMHKLGARNAVGMVRIALEKGLLE